MLVKIDNVKVICTDYREFGDLSVGISRQTALVFAGGKNIFSLYPCGLSIEEAADVLMECCADYDVDIKPGEAAAAAEWMIKTIGGSSLC